jgi:hypothetical protein
MNIVIKLKTAVEAYMPVVDGVLAEKLDEYEVLCMNTLSTNLS